MTPTEKPASMPDAERDDKKPCHTVFAVIRSLTDDPDVLLAVAQVEQERREAPDTSWVRTESVRGRYRGRHRR